MDDKHNNHNQNETTDRSLASTVVGHAAVHLLRPSGGHHSPFGHPPPQYGQYGQYPPHGYSPYPPPGYGHAGYPPPGGYPPMAYMPPGAYPPPTAGFPFSSHHGGHGSHSPIAGLLSVAGSALGAMHRPSHGYHGHGSYGRFGLGHRGLDESEHGKFGENHDYSGGRGK